MGRCNKGEKENEISWCQNVPGCTSIEINSTVYEFDVGDPSHMRMREIYYMLARAIMTSLGSKEHEGRDGLVSVALLRTKLPFGRFQLQGKRLFGLLQLYFLV